MNEPPAPLFEGCRNGQGDMTMSGHRKSDAAVHQPSRAKQGEDMRIDAMHEELVWAATRGDAERREADGGD